MELNFTLPNFIVGLLGLALGAVLVKEAFYINHHILFLDWVEQKWGSGTGTQAYRLVGLLLCIFSMCVIIGLVNVFEKKNLAPGGGGSRTQPVRVSPAGTPSNIAP